MKILVAAILGCGIAWSQIPTTGLLEQYDMVTLGGGGTTLTDLSGNGNAGTLHGTTPGATGIAFNGSSDYIAIPAVIGSSDFTVFACTTGDSAMSGFIWSEVNASTSNNLRYYNGGVGQVQGVSTSAATSFPSFPSQIQNDWHCYYFERQGSNTLIWGSPDLGVQVTTSASGVGAVTTTQGALGAQDGTSPNSFYTGTIGYALVYNVALPLQSINAIYVAAAASLASRGVNTTDVASPLYPSGVWNRMGVVIAGTAGTQYSEPSVLYTTTDCVQVANPCFQMWLSNSAHNIVYTESLDGINWHAPSGSLVTNHNQQWVLKSGSTYFMYNTNVSSPNGIDLYQSTGNSPTGFTLTGTTVIPLGANATFDHTQINNMSVISVGSTFYMAYEATGNAAGQGPTVVCGGATSADGITWTKTGALTQLGWSQGCTSPTLYYNASLSSPWNLWNVSRQTPYSSVYRNVATSFTKLFRPLTPVAIKGEVTQLPVMPGSAPDEQGNMAGFHPIEVNGKTYAYVNAQASGAPYNIKLYIANMPLLQVVQTGEGVSSNVP